MFLQQGLTGTPRSVRGVFEHLYVELPGVVHALVTALIVCGWKTRYSPDTEIRTSVNT